MNFVFSDRQACVITDTGMFQSGKAEPVRFTTKTLCLPHLRMVVAACGNSGLICEWKQWLMLGMPVADIDELDEMAPVQLRAISANRGGPEATVLHLGVDRNERMVGFQYASANGFASEQLEPRTSYIHPGFVATETADASHTDSPPAPHGNGQASDAEVFVPTWHDYVRTIVNATHRQHREHTDVTGGRVIATFLRADQIHQTWFDLATGTNA